MIYYNKIIQQADGSWHLELNHKSEIRFWRSESASLLVFSENSEEYPTAAAKQSDK
jgi:hypothetical protein